MTLLSWITMILVLGIVWGGLVVILWTAVRKERGKVQTPPPTP